MTERLCAWSDLVALMGQGESAKLHFIAWTEHEDDVGPSLVALANQGCGTLVLGLDVKNYHLLGCEFDKKWIDFVIARHCSPVFLTECAVVIRNELRVLVVEITACPQPPYHYKGEIYVRDQHLTRVANEKDMANFIPPPVTAMPASAIQEIVTSRLFAPDPEVVVQPGHLPAPEGEVRPPVDPRLSLPIRLPKHVVPARPVLVVPADMAANEIRPQTSAPRPEEPAASVPVLEALPQLPQPVYKEVFAPEFRGNSLLNNRQLKALEFLDSHPTIRNKEYRALFGVSHKTAHLELVQLVALGYIMSQGSGRSTCYVINKSGATQSSLVFQTMR